ncbi:MAG: sulfotransferase family 2 domain-containing protein, partial [Anaerolineae bacterium]|nr:sulfotransferase family 2 domain-containing protein [Anaerolineae bacterium]
MPTLAKLPKGVQIPRICIFLHIPRTGGTTIRLVAEANLPEGQILPIYGPDIEHPEQALQRLHEPTRRALKMIRGHISFGIHRHLPWAECYYFTLVRNPMERVWSLWNYAYRHKTHHLYQALRELGTIEAAVRSG